MARKTNPTGITARKAEHLGNELNELLANYSVFYQNVRGFHWNMRGEKFRDLRGKFEELYTDLAVKKDEIAERILMLGGVPEHTFASYLQTSRVKPTESVRDGKAAVKNIVSALEDVLLLQRELLSETSEAGDDGTNSMMSDYIRAQEELVWMYGAYLS